MKPRTPSRGAAQGGRAHLRLLGGVGEARAASSPDELSAELSDEELSADAPSGEGASVGELSNAHVPSGGPVSGQLAALAALADAPLVALARTGERRAFEVLYRRHVSFAIHLATRIEGSSRDVEDIVHDAFIKAFSRLGDLSEPSAFRSWLGSIVVFAVRSRLRRTRLMNLLGLGRGADPVDLDSLASADASPHTRAQLAQIYALLRTRPTDERIAWTLRCVEGHELEVVARLTSCSLATVKRRISRMQDFLDEHFVTEAVAQGPLAAGVAAPTRMNEGSPARTPTRGPLDAIASLTPTTNVTAVTPIPTTAESASSRRKSRP